PESARGQALLSLLAVASHQLIYSIDQGIDVIGQRIELVRRFRQCSVGFSHKLPHLSVKLSDLIAESVPGDGQLGNDPFEAVQALVDLQGGFVKTVQALVRSVRALLGLRLAFRDAVQALLDLQEGFVKTVQTFVRSVRALLGLPLALRDECDSLFEVHPIEY